MIAAGSCDTPLNPYEAAIAEQDSNVGAQCTG